MARVISKAQDEMTAISIMIGREMGLTDKGKGMYFTGWKDATGFTASSGYVGQIVLWVKGEKGVMAAYVNLPGMECGVIPQGACFEIGEARVVEVLTVDEMRDLLVRGIKKMNEMVSEKNLEPYIA